MRKSRGMAKGIAVVGGSTLTFFFLEGLELDCKVQQHDHHPVYTVYGIHDTWHGLHMIWICSKSFWKPFVGGTFFLSFQDWRLGVYPLCFTNEDCRDLAMLTWSGGSPFEG